MERYRVAIVSGDDPLAMVRQAVDLAGKWPQTIAGSQRVFIKPNLTVPRPSGSGVVTDVRVVEGVIILLKEAGGKEIMVGDGPGAHDAAEAFRVAGYDYLPQRYGVTLVDLNQAPTRRVSVPKGLRYQELEIPEAILEADAFLNISLIKTHTDGLVTLTAKNMFGVPPNRFYGRPRFHFHRQGVDEVVYDINQAVRIDYAIIDGLVGMEEAGPIEGTPVRLNLIIAGKNPVAVDTVCVHLMGLDPHDVKHLRYLYEAGRGPLDLAEIEVVGEPIEKVRRPFRLPKPGTMSWAEELARAYPGAKPAI